MSHITYAVAGQRSLAAVHSAAHGDWKRIKMCGGDIFNLRNTIGSAHFWPPRKRDDSGSEGSLAALRFDCLGNNMIRLIC